VRPDVTAVAPQLPLPRVGRPVRVLHVDTEREWGGGQRQLWALATGMQRRGWATWVVARPGTRLAAELSTGGVTVFPVTPAFEWDPVAVRRLRGLLRTVGAEVVHAHAAHAVALAALARRGTGTRLLAARRVALPLHRNPLSRWKYASAAGIVAVSERVRQALRESGVAASHIAVIRSGVDLLRPAARASEATLAALGVVRRRPLVVMVSALVPPHKDPETFVRAIAAARAGGCDLQALLVGDGPLAAGTARTCRRLGLEGVLRLTGSRADAAELLAAADVAVLSSRDEGLGTSLLDAMLAGVPVVATAAGGVREVVRAGIDGLLVPVGDGGALGAAIARVLREPLLRAALVAAGHRRVREFSIEGTVEATLATYRRLVPCAATEAESWA
jgi:glycosyltransferase involved in cell wall biosynthesis